MAGLDTLLLNDLAFYGGDLVRVPRGDIGTITGLANYKNALFHRLMTVPGSLAHRPLYGVGVGNFQNALNSFSQQQKLAALITEQFEKDPRTDSVKGVAISSEDGSPQNVKIKVTVTPKGYTEQTMTFLPFSGINS